MPQVTTQMLRDTARQNVIDSVTEYATNSHLRNYYTLHIRRDGSVSWFEAPDANSDLIDPDASGFAAIASVGQTGCGGFGCNCQWCNEVYNAREEAEALDTGREYNRANKYASQDDAIYEAVSDSDLSGVEEMLLNALNEIPVGYFSDEDEA